MSDDQRIHRTNSQNFAGQNSGGTEEAGEQTLRGTDRNSRAEPRTQKIRVALVHDWLNGMRGGEIVFEALLDVFPDADVYTLIYEPKKISARLNEKLSRTHVRTSWLNYFSFTRNRYRQLLPLLPCAIRSFYLRDYDLVVSSSHCVAKGIRKHKKIFHISYIHAPMRYMWDRFDDYFGRGKVNPLIRFAAILFRPFLQWWDRRMAKEKQVDVLLANSRFIAGQIRRCYDRNSKVVYPFAKLERFSHARKPGNFYLMVTAFAPYKRTDLAMLAFARLGLPLKIVGSGQDEESLHQLKRKLGATNIEFIKNPDNATIEALYSQCKAFIFPGKEDFGITPLEAMASGAPVIAFGEGGACETLTPQTGILFSRQTVDALCDAVMDLESGRKRFSEDACRERARFFTEERFKQEILSLLP